MTAHKVRYCNGTSALKPECSRYRNENERIIDYSSASECWKRRDRRTSKVVVCPENRRESIRDALSAAVDESATMRDLRAGNLSGTPLNKSDSWKMSWFAAIYTLTALAAIVGVAL